MKEIKSVIIVIGILISLPLLAASSIPSLNQCPDMIFIDGHENESIPSNGSGGAYPGNVQPTVFVNKQMGSHQYYVYLPTSYDPNVAMPMLILWHGVAGAGNAHNQAQAVRSIWDDVAEEYNFIIVAQAATGSVGHWVSNDQYVWDAIMNDMESNYNIETTRKYFWGFSAGGHWVHALGLLNADLFAAYAVNSGELGFAAANGIFPGNAPRKIPVYVSIGDTDPNYPLTQNDRLTFLEAGWTENQDYWFDVFNGGHTVPTDVPAKIWDKICISTNLD